MPKDMPTYAPNFIRHENLEADASATAVKARIAQFCAWFDVPPVKLKVRKENVYMTDELLAWCKEHGASIDWIICGDAAAMAAMLRFVLLKVAPEKAALANKTE